MAASIKSATPLRDLLTEESRWPGGDPAVRHFRSLEDKLLAATSDDELPAILDQMRSEVTQ